MIASQAVDSVERKVTGPLADRIDELETDPDFVAEGLALRIMEEAARIMAEQNISRSDLAARMGVTRARVTQLFNAPPNLTLRSIAQLAIALESIPHASLLPTCLPAPNTIGA